MGSSISSAERPREDVSALSGCYDGLAGRVLGIRPLTVATALLFRYRFYSKNSMVKTDTFALSVAALFVACKANHEACAGSLLARMYDVQVQDHPILGAILEEAEIFPTLVAYLHASISG